VSDEQGFIIDAAASFDSLSRVGLKENSPYVVVVSLHATKVFGVGEGAFVFSNDIGWVDRIKSWSRFGFKMGRSSEVIGNNAKMSEYSAAVGLANFDIWNETLMKYREVNSRAREISNSLGLRTHYAMEKGFISPYWIIELGHKEQKRILQKSLIENEIPFRDWWEQGCHNMPAFNSVPVSDLTKTVMVAEKTIGLPFHTYLSETYWEMISELLQSL
jgi:dTDP-4-amino-4,6-dideoxygalactose transaminase